MRKLNTLLLLFLLTLVFTGCDKDEDKEPTKEQLLMAKNWNPTAIKLSATVGGNNLELDYFAQLNACQKDNFLKFDSGGKVILDEGPNKCSGAPQTVQGTWSLNGDILTIDGPVLTSFGLSSTTAKTLTIQELTNQTLRVTTIQPVSVPNSPLPLNATIDITFTGQ
jgi:hypothetical protein